MSTPANFPPPDSMVRRTDVALRALYPHLETRIFEIAPHRFQIVFDRELLDAASIEPRRIVGDRLNFYRSFNSRIAAAWAVSERRKEERRSILPPVPLFDFHHRASIDDLIAATSLGSTRRNTTFEMREQPTRKFPLRLDLTREPNTALVQHQARSPMVRVFAGNPG